MAEQEPYEIGKIVKELAEAKGIQIKPLVINLPDTHPTNFYHMGPLYNLGVSDWLMHRIARENEVAFEGKNELYHFVYGGSQNFSKITSEGVYITTPERIITILREVRSMSNYIEVRDRKAGDALRVFRTMRGSPDHPCDGRFRGSIGFIDEDIPKLKNALDALI